MARARTTVRLLATVRAVTDCQVLSADLSDVRAAAARDEILRSALGASVAFKHR